MSAENVKNIITQNVQQILDKKYKSEPNRRKIDVYNDRIGFNCPICDDSVRDSRKKRGNIYWDSMVFHCYNCSAHMGVNYFLKQFGETLDVNTKLAIKEYKTEHTRFSSSTSVNSTNLILFSLLNKLAVPYDLFLKVNHLVPANKNKTSLDYLKSRLINKYSKFAYNEKTNELYVLNVNNSGAIIGYQIRQLDKNSSRPRYMSFRISNMYRIMFNKKIDTYVQNILSTVDGGEQYIESEDGIEGVVDNLDKLSLLFNILTVDFSRDLTICEGPIDSMFINNCIALCGASKLNNYFDDIPYVRYLFDNDVTGKEHSINKVKDGKKTFLWNKYLDEIGLRDSKIKDMNDLVIELYRNRNRVKFDADRFNSCFSDNELDAVYI